MVLNYSFLKSMAQKGHSLGEWRGRKVFSCSVSELQNKGTGAYYILYDDKNKLVGKDGTYYYSYGIVSESGGVDEYSSRRKYSIKKEEKVETVPTYTPGYDVSERPCGDVAMEIDVEAVLKKARDMTIDDLLDNFMMGLWRA